MKMYELDGGCTCKIPCSPRRKDSILPDNKLEKK
jgi:hypothetical protein